MHGSNPEHLDFQVGGMFKSIMMSDCREIRTLSACLECYDRLGDAMQMLVSSE